MSSEITDYSNIRDQVKDAHEDAKGGGGIKLIPDGSENAFHNLRFISGSVKLSKSKNLMVELCCQVIAKDKKAPEHKKKENLFYVFKTKHQRDEWYRILDWLGFDWDRIGEKWIDEDWEDVIEEMMDAPGKIMLNTLFTFQDKVSRKNRYNKRVVNGVKGVKAEDDGYERDYVDMDIEWPESTKPKAGKKTKAKADAGAKIEIDEDDC